MSNKIRYLFAGSLETATSYFEKGYGLENLMDAIEYREKFKTTRNVVNKLFRGEFIVTEKVEYVVAEPGAGEECLWDALPANTKIGTVLPTDEDSDYFYFQYYDTCRRYCVKELERYNQTVYPTPVALRVTKSEKWVVKELK